MSRTIRWFSAARRFAPVLATPLLLLLTLLLLRATPVAGGSAPDPSHLHVERQPQLALMGESPAQGISGTVTNFSGQPLSVIRVRLCDISSTTSCIQIGGDKFTDSDGKYFHNDLPVGSYKVMFMGDLVEFPLYDHYPNKPTLSEALPVVVNAGAVTPDIDGKLTAHSRITGYIKDSGGIGIPNAQALICDPEFVDYCSGPDWPLHGAHAQSDSSGFFELNRLPVGSYRIQFSHESYLTEYYNNKYDFSMAQTVTVGIEGHTPINDVVLVKASTIAGTIRNEQEIAVPFAHPLFLALDGSGVGFGATANVHGEYQTTSMAAGEWLITFYGADGTDTYLSHTITYTVLEATNHTLDQTLYTARHISGTVTAEAGGAPIANIRVGACPASNGCTSIFDYQMHEADTDGSGRYHINGLMPGEYYLIFSTIPGAYLAELHNNIVGFQSASSVNLAGATKVNLTSAEVAVINAQLGFAPTISGHVTRQSNGASFPGVTVTICRVVGDDCDSLHSEITDAAGLYAFDGLLPGAYRLRFNDHVEGIYP